MFTGGRSRTGDPPCGGTNSTNLHLPSATLLLKSAAPDGVYGIRCTPESPSICGAHTGAGCSLLACRRLASYSRRSKRSACRMAHDTEGKCPLNCLPTSMVWLQVRKRWATRSEQEKRSRWLVLMVCSCLSWQNRSLSPKVMNV